MGGARSFAGPDDTPIEGRGGRGDRGPRAEPRQSATRDEPAPPRSIRLRLAVEAHEAEMHPDIVYRHATASCDLIHHATTAQTQRVAHARPVVRRRTSIRGRARAV